MPRRCLYLLLAVILASHFFSVSRAAAEQPPTQYLLFQVLTGGPDPTTGVFSRLLAKDELHGVVKKIAKAVRPASNDPNRILGFSVGPIAMDQGADDARAAISEAFDIALKTDMAVAVHLDDFMFWKKASWPDGRFLRDMNGTAEWTDWAGTAAPPLKIGWLENANNLAPQMCYESPSIKSFVRHWVRDVIGLHIKKQLDRLIEAGKQRLFAGVFVGWESNLSYGYCSLTNLGFSALNPPVEFDRKRQRIVQRHIGRFAKGIYDAGIPRDLIFTHIGVLSQQQYDNIVKGLTPEELAALQQSTTVRAPWVAFNDYSLPGFSGYLMDIFGDIYDVVDKFGGRVWGIPEGSNGPPMHGLFGHSPLSWETYLARSFNHGAKVVNLFGGFQGATDAAGEPAPVESQEAIAAYRKFLRGKPLVESGTR